MTDTPLLTDAEFHTFGHPLATSQRGTYTLRAAFLTDDPSCPAVVRLYSVADCAPVQGSCIITRRTVLPSRRRLLPLRVARGLLSRVGAYVFPDYRLDPFLDSAPFQLLGDGREFIAQFGGVPGASYRCYSVSLIQHFNTPPVGKAELYGGF